jgi:hypothetical protein
MTPPLDRPNDHSSPEAESSLQQFGHEHLAQEILRQVAARGADKSICPSEVARALMPDPAPWQRLMAPLREVAFALARQGRLDILRKGHKVPIPADPAAIKGVIRLRHR